MPLNEQQQHDLNALSDIAEQVGRTCPDLRQRARDVALQLLEQQGLGALEPDSVYFHRFHATSSSPLTFNGWQHHERPYQTLTLPQLVMARFNPAEQEASDLLDQFTGFYSSGPACERFDESNEIPLAPRSVMTRFWEIDFSSDFHARISRFWQQHADDYRTLAKASFLSKVVEVCAHAPGSALAKRALSAAHALTGIQRWPVSLSLLREQFTRAAAPAQLRHWRPHRQRHTPAGPGRRQPAALYSR